MHSPILLTVLLIIALLAIACGFFGLVSDWRQSRRPRRRSDRARIDDVFDAAADDMARAAYGRDEWRF